jgi:hypothetical protein
LASRLLLRVGTGGLKTLEKLSDGTESSVPFQSAETPIVLVKRIALLLVVVSSLVFLVRAYTQQEHGGQTSYAKVDSTESFESIMARMTAAKPGIESAHLALLDGGFAFAER